MLEIEFKIKIKDSETYINLLKNRYTYKGIVEKWDTYYSYNDFDMFRIRKEKFGDIISYKVNLKEKNFIGKFEVNDELEFSVSNIADFTKFISNFNCEKKYEKYKKSYLFTTDNINIEILKINELGWFLEAEATLFDRQDVMLNIEKLKNVLKFIGKSEEDIITESYISMLKPFEKIINIYTDGGCHGNPGPGAWSFVVLDAKDILIGGYDAMTTNNRMELQAVIEAVNYAKGKYEKIKIHTDSMYVKDGITSWIKKWRLNGWRTSAGHQVKNYDLWSCLDSSVEKMDIVWEWVKGHSNNKYNEMCDGEIQKIIKKFAK